MAHQFSKPMKVLLVGGMNYQGGTVSALKFAPAHETQEKQDVLAVPFTASGEVGGFLSPRAQGEAGGREDRAAAQMSFMSGGDAPLVVKQEQAAGAGGEADNDGAGGSEPPASTRTEDCTGAHEKLCKAYENAEEEEQKELKTPKWWVRWTRVDPFLSPLANVAAKTLACVSSEMDADLQKNLQTLSDLQQQHAFSTIEELQKDHRFSAYPRYLARYLAPITYLKKKKAYDWFKNNFKSNWDCAELQSTADVKVQQEQVVEPVVATPPAAAETADVEVQQGGKPEPEGPPVKLPEAAAATATAAAKPTLPAAPGSGSFVPAAATNTGTANDSKGPLNPTNANAAAGASSVAAHVKALEKTITAQTPPVGAAKAAPTAVPALIGKATAEAADIEDVPQELVKK